MIDGKKKIIEHIKSRMKEPVITEEKSPIPELVFFTAYEKAWLVEDPLIPNHFYCYKNGEVKRSFDINEVVYMPGNKESALSVSVWMLEHSYSYVRIKKAEYHEEKGGAKADITVDFYFEHPYFRREPVKDLVFIVNCINGRWSIKEPDGLWEKDLKKKQEM